MCRPSPSAMSSISNSPPSVNSAASSAFGRHQDSRPHEVIKGRVDHRQFFIPRSVIPQGVSHVSGSPNFSLLLLEEVTSEGRGHLYLVSPHTTRHQSSRTSSVDEAAIRVS